MLTRCDRMQRNTRWPPHVLEQGCNLSPDASLLHMWDLEHSYLGGDFPLSRSLEPVHVAVARPWRFLDRVILHCMRGELPKLRALHLCDFVESQPWAPPLQLTNLTVLMNLKLLALPPFKACP